MNIATTFPDISPWLAWYLDTDRAQILFPACKNLLGLSSCQRQKFEVMKKDTNGQEGLGGFLQSMAKSSKEGLYKGLTTCSTFIDRYNRLWNWAKSGNLSQV